MYWLNAYPIAAGTQNMAYVGRRKMRKNASIAKSCFNKSPSIPTLLPALYTQLCSNSCLVVLKSFQVHSSSTTNQDQDRLGIIEPFSPALYTADSAAPQAGSTKLPVSSKKQCYCFQRLRITNRMRMHPCLLSILKCLSSYLFGA